MATSEKTVAPKERWYRHITRGTSLYGFELVVATIGLLVTAGVLIYGIYALCNYLLGIDSLSARQFSGELSVWLMAAMIVWLPLTLFFYLRTRAETVRNPKRETTSFHKFIVSAYRFILLMTAIGLLFSVVYTAIRLLIGIEDNASDTTLRVIMPGLLSTVVAGGCMVAYNRSHVPSRRLFSLIIGLLSVAVMVAVLAVSVGSIRDDAKDNRTVSDLNTLQSSVTAYYNDKETVPEHLNQLNGLEKGVQDRLDAYTYTRVSSVRYRLCATFMTDTEYDRGVALPASEADSYVYYADFYSHSEGEQCYNITASYVDGDDSGSVKNAL